MVRIRLRPPVVVSLAPLGETRWGYWNFPYLFRMPDGELALTHHARPDSETEYGQRGPLHLSHDEGASWREVDPPAPELGLHPTHMVHLDDGECFFIAPGPPIPDDAMGDAQPVGRLESYGEVDLYDLAAVPADRRAMTLMRWLPAERRWRREQSALDLPHGLLWRRPGGFANLFIESKPIIAHDDGAVIVADFRNAVRLPEGRPPQRRGTAVLESTDRGRTWRQRGLVAYDDRTMYAEPFLAYATSGELLCTLRSTRSPVDEPMYLARSGDHGRTWGSPEHFDDVGVFPSILTLGCGVMVVSYGRPGVWLRLTDDPRARRWDPRHTLVEPDPASNTAATCGYTSLEPLDDRRFLVAYSDFRHVDGNGERRKAILVREVEIVPEA